MKSLFPGKKGQLKLNISFTTIIPKLLHTVTDLTSVIYGGLSDTCHPMSHTVTADKYHPMSHTATDLTNSQIWWFI